MTFTKAECDGRYFLYVSPDTYDSSDSGGLGRGGSMTTYAFGSEEARNYFILLLDLQEIERALRHQYESLRSEVLACVTATGRVRRKRVLELAKAVRS